jgi:hypothetical protein
MANSLPRNVVLDHLVSLPYSLKNLGALNDDGWGLAYYNGSAPVVMRGELPAKSDPNFDLTAQELAESRSNIGVGHVRLAASGAYGIPDPHPFIRCEGGKWWAFGHNGVLSKASLENLIGPEYLEKNPPSVGDNWSDPAVVDSDLYMLYVLKCTEESYWNVTVGISKAVTDISRVDGGSMNFFLTDGETLWGFCRGSTLYYCYNSTFPQYSAIASQPPSSNDEGWVELHDNNLIRLERNSPPRIADNIIAVFEFSHPTMILLLLTITAFVTAIISKKPKQLRACASQLYEI